MKSFLKKRPCSAKVLLLALSVGASTPLISTPATLSFQNGDTLSGDFLRFTPSGAATFQPNAAAGTVTLKPNTLKAATFYSSAPTSTSSGNERITLQNGDSLRCNILAISDDSITFDTWFASGFHISRALVTQIAFNQNIPIKTALSEILWKQESKEQWKISPTSLSCQGKGSISHTSPLSQNFIIQCQATWTGHKPRFKIYFCADTTHLEAVTDAYYLDVSGNGISLHRNSPSSPPQQLGKFSLNLNRNNHSPLDIEILVDRKNKQIALDLGDLGRRVFNDLSITAPPANGILISSEHNLSQKLTLDNFTLYQWADDLLELDHAELDTERDSLIDDEKAVFRGKLNQMQTSKGEKQLLFTLDSSGQHFPIPFTHLRLLSLGARQDAAEQASSAFHVELTDSTSLGLSELEFHNGTATVKHPILGEFSFNANALRTLSVMTPTPHD